MNANTTNTPRSFKGKMLKFGEFLIVFLAYAYILGLSLGVIVAIVNLIGPEYILGILILSAAALLAYNDTLL